MICEEGASSEQFWVNSFEINRSCFNFALNDEFKKLSLQQLQMDILLQVCL